MAGRNQKNKFILALLIVLGAAMCLAGIGRVCLQHEKKEENRDITDGQSVQQAETSDRVVSLSCENGNGNGVLWCAETGEAVLVAPLHVTGREKPENLKVDGCDIEILKYMASDIYDLVFIQVSIDGGGAVEEPDESGYDELKAGDDVWVHGFLAGEEMYLEGTVLSNWILMEDFGYHMIWAEVSDVKGGMSGSGVFDSQGRMVGILCGGDGQDEIAVLPISLIQSEWKNQGGMY